MRLAEGGEIRAASHKVTGGNEEKEIVLNPIMECFTLQPVYYKFWKI